jgi:biotin carboxyl carrier protein
MRLRRDTATEDFNVEVLARDADSIRVRVGDREISAAIGGRSSSGARIVVIDGHRYRVMGARGAGAIFVAVGAQTFRFVPAESAARRRARGPAAPEIVAPMPGKILRIMVAEGDTVEQGQPLAVIEAMKMETTLAAEGPAVIGRIRVAVGDMVDHGAVILELSPADGSSAPESAARAG